MNFGVGRESDWKRQAINDLACFSAQYVEGEEKTTRSFSQVMIKEIQHHIYLRPDWTLVIMEFDLLPNIHTRTSPSNFCIKSVTSVRTIECLLEKHPVLMLILQVM